MEWKDAIFIDREKQWKGRKIKEALYINVQNPTRAADKNGLLNLEKGLDVNPIRGDFNVKLSKTMHKKIQRTD